MRLSPETQRAPARPRRSFKFAVPFVVGVVVAVIAGCGGSEQEDLSKSEFIADADAICAQHVANSGALEDQFDQALKSGDLETAAEGFQEQADEVSAMLDQLETLSAPVADQTTVEQIIALGRERVELAKQASEAIGSGDKKAMIAAGRQGSVLAGQYYQLADSFGFKTCGSGGGTRSGSAAVVDPAGATGSTGDVASQ